MTTVDNIIPFPKAHVKQGGGSPQPPNLEEVREAIQFQKELDIEETCAIFSTFLVEQLTMAGYQFNGLHAKDLCLIFESIRSLLHKYHDLEHPLHELVEKSFTITPEGVHFFAPRIVVTGDDDEEPEIDKEETPDDDSGSQ